MKNATGPGLAPVAARRSKSVTDLKPDVNRSQPRKLFGNPDRPADSDFKLQLVRLIDMAGGDDGYDANQTSFLVSIHLWMDTF